jgi:hypothetical protein
MSHFDTLLSTLPKGMRDRITPALDQVFADVDELRASVAGMTRADITSFLQRILALGEVDASALAGLLVVPTGNYYISISYLNIPSII